MPVQQLIDYRNRLAELHLEPAAASAAAQLSALESELDSLQANWTQTLLANLEDPTVQGNLALLKPEEKKLIDAFLASGKLPDKLDQQLLQAVHDALAGLVKVAVKVETLKDALVVGGSPATLAEMRQRYEGVPGGPGEGQGSRQGAADGGVTAFLWPGNCNCFQL